MVIPIGVCTPTGCEESSHPVQGAVFMGFVVPVVRAEKRARTTGYCPFTPPAWQKRPNSRGAGFSSRSLTAKPLCVFLPSAERFQTPAEPVTDAALWTAGLPVAIENALRSNPAVLRCFGPNAQERLRHTNREASPSPFDAAVSS